MIKTPTDYQKEGIELPPCPWCRKLPFIISAPKTEKFDAIYEVACCTETCQMEPATPPMKTKKEAIDLWRNMFKLDIETIIDKIKNESWEYAKSYKAAVDWIMIPEHILRQVLKEN